jgi:hypothetical protein
MHASRSASLFFRELRAENAAVATLPDVRRLPRVVTEGSATSNIKHDPRGSVVAGVFFTPHTSVYTAVYQPLRYHRREKEMVEPHALVGRPPVALVIPECPERPIWVQSPQSVCPALSQHSGKGLATFRLDQRVVV